MSAPLVEVPDGQARDHLELTNALEAVALSDVPCRASAAAYSWTSDDPAEQAVAARACRPCPLVQPCRSYGLAWPREMGVYGALTHTDRKRINRTERKSA